MTEAATTDTRALEAEREFLLRSLDDLDAERDAGNVDGATYRTLHADYTARAAAVIRAIEGDDEPALPKPPAAPRWVRFATALGIVVFAVAVAVFLARAVGTRNAGQTATGNAQTGNRIETLRATAEARPDDYDARIAYARELLGEDRVAALAEFDAAAELDATKPEPIAYAGWIIGLAAREASPGADRDLLISRSLERLGAAIALDPQYLDAYVFRGIVTFEVVGDAAAAVADFQAFLALAPGDHPMREVVLGALQRAVEQSPSTTTPPTNTTPTTETTGGP